MNSTALRIAVLDRLNICRNFPTSRIDAIADQIIRDCMETAAQVCDEKKKKYEDTHADCTDGDDRFRYRCMSLAAHNCSVVIRELIPAKTAGGGESDE